MTEYIEEIKKFFNENEHFRHIPTLKEKLEKFKTFDISDVKGDYSKCTGGYDQDDTYVSRQVMYVIWHNELPDLTCIDDIGTGGKYRGETINTFNTLFKEDCSGIDKFLDNTPEDNKLKTMIKEFKKEYTTIGNFMLFPNDCNYNGQSINILKNNLCHDYADLFFKEIWDNRLYEYCLNMGETNRKYFEKFKGYKDFCKVNFLEKYLENDKPKIVFIHADYNGKYFIPYFYWNRWASDEFKNNYKKFAKNYIEQSRVIIKDRAEIICGKLLELIKDK